MYPALLCICSWVHFSARYLNILLVDKNIIRSLILQSTRRAGLSDIYAWVYWLFSFFELSFGIIVKSYTENVETCKTFMVVEGVPKIQQDDNRQDPPQFLVKKELQHRDVFENPSS